MKKLLVFILSITVFILTFPNLEPIYGLGLDYSYYWAFNWLFANDYGTLKDLIYPLGPLYFLKTPTTQGNNLIIHLIFYTVLKFAFILTMFYTAKQKSLCNNYKGILFTAVLIYIASLLLFTDYLIVFTCVLWCFNAINETSGVKNVLLFTLAAALGLTGLFIKSSIGVASLSAVGVAWLINSVEKKNVRISLCQAVCMIIVCLLYGSIVFKGIGGFFYFLNGTAYLVGGYGDTLSLHPANIWSLLITGLLLIAVYPLIVRSKDTRNMFLILLIPLFSAWKHAMVREDDYHYIAVIFFLIAYWVVMAMTDKQKLFVGLLLGIICVNAFYINGRIIFKPSLVSWDLNRAEYFIDYFFRFNETSEKYKTKSLQLIKADKLPEDIINEVGNKTIDFYPWEHSFAVANGLENNWRGRKTVELGASTSLWASNIAAMNFTKDKGVDYVLWHLKYFDKTQAIDGRYFLNDEPTVVYNILNNYDTVKMTKNAMLFKHHNHKSNFDGIKTDKPKAARFNQWIDINAEDDEILRLRIKSKKTLIGKIKSFLYKDEIYFIDYKTLDNKIHSYRYIPWAAEEGLWVNPFVTFKGNNIIKNKIIQVRLRHTGGNCVKENIIIQTEKID